MAGKHDIEAKTEELIKPITDMNNVSIYDIEYVKEGSDYYLRVYIDKEGGVNIEDCDKVSRAFSDVLDVNDYIEEAYILEVSSPGLGRQLKKDRHFAGSIGEEVCVKLYEAEDGKKEFVGRLDSFSKDELIINIEGNNRIFNRSKISSVKLTLDF